MTKSNRCFALRGFGEIFGHDCHAMPISWSGEGGRFNSLTPPVFIMANGISVPISRGKPPGLSVQA